MMDEHFDRGYQAGRAELNDGIDRLGRSLRDLVAPAMTALHRFEWDAPWNARAKPKH